MYNQIRIKHQILIVITIIIIVTSIIIVDRTRVIGKIIEDQRKQRLVKDGNVEGWKRFFEKCTKGTKI